MMISPKWLLYPIYRKINIKNIEALILKIELLYNSSCRNIDVKLSISKISNLKTKELDIPTPCPNHIGPSDHSVMLIAVAVDNFGCTCTL